jgi:hypothetical protein
MRYGNGNVDRKRRLRADDACMEGSLGAVGLAEGDELWRSTGPYFRMLERMATDAARLRKAA